MRLSDKIALAVSSFFYVGYLPFIPGTYGSFAGALLFYFFSANTAVYLALVVFLILAGFLSAGRAEQALGMTDPKYVVIDEVSGMMLSFVGIAYSLKIAVIGFFIFRILDTLKPYPADRFQNLKGSSGIMLDDITAGLYTNIILQVVLRFASCRAS